MDSVNQNKSISLSDSALKRIRSVTEAEKDSNFRVYVTGGGCAGFSYGFKFDKERNTLVEPYLTNHEIGIVHFAGKHNDQIRNDKNFVSKIETVDGEIINKKLRFSK